MSTTQYELLNIETYVLRVHMNCQGCISKVRKVLSKIKGVYTVEINAEQQTVTVTGNVNLSTLVQKLTKFKKHVEIWDAGYNQEQVNHVTENNNKNQAQYIVNDHNAYENQYLIPNFGRDQWEAEWYLNKHKGTTDLGRVINPHLAEPLFMEHVNNTNNHGFSTGNENPIWEESMNFQQYNDPYHSHLGSQEWAWNHHTGSPIGVYNQQLFTTNNKYHPSNAMQQSYYNNLPYGINFY